MNRYFRSTQFSGRPGAAFAVAGAQSTPVGQASAVPSGPNATALASVRCERSGHIALPASCPPNIVPGVVMDERLALLSDEGQNSSNAQAMREHVDGKQYDGTTIESLVNAVSRAEENAQKEAK